MAVLTVPFEMSELVEYFLHRHFLTVRLCAVAPGASLPGGQQLLSGSAPNNEQRPSRKQGGRGTHAHTHTAIDRLELLGQLPYKRNATVKTNSLLFPGIMKGTTGPNLFFNFYF